jgi:spermidine synthase
LKISAPKCTVSGVRFDYPQAVHVTSRVMSTRFHIRSHALEPRRRAAAGDVKAVGKAVKPALALIAMKRAVQRCFGLVGLLAVVGLHPRAAVWASPEPTSPTSPTSPIRPSSGDGLVVEGRSDFSHYKVVDEQGRRTLRFVQDDGTEVLESSILFQSPDTLVVPYTQAMFASLLFRPVQERCLIIGLGGGAMVRFLNRHLPETRVDAVEIDPAIVDVASRFFGVGPNASTRIFTEDAFGFVRRSAERYDVIYMDAFLKPEAGMDASGAPLRLQTKAFLRDLQAHLMPGGLLVVNLLWHRDMWDDVVVLRETFPTVYRFPVAGRGNLIVVASTSAQEIDAYSLREAGRRLDKGDAYGFSFERLANTLDND